MTTTRRSPRSPVKKAKNPPKDPGRTPVARAKADRPSDWTRCTAEDVMVRRVVTVHADATLTEVERVLADNRISGVPVTDDDGCVLGVLSVRDIIEHHAEEGRQKSRGPSFYQLDAGDFDEDELDAFDLPEDPTATAQQVMTPQVLAVAPGTPLREVAARMVKNNVHRLLVQDDDRMVGIVSAMDLLRALAN